MYAVGGRILELGHDLQPYQPAVSTHCTPISPEHCPMAQRGAGFIKANDHQCPLKACQVIMHALNCFSLWHVDLTAPGTIMLEPWPKASYVENS
jgi:hypothetical protein